MAKYDTFLLGYKAESTYGSASLTQSTDTAYRLGIINADIELPDVKMKLTPIQGDAEKYDPTDYVKAAFAFQREINVLPVDGVLNYYIFGSCTTTGTSAPYTHTITRVTGGGELPSFTLKQEIKDSTSTLTNIYKLWTGVKISAATISCSPTETDGLLLYTLSLMAREGSLVNWALDNAPGWHSASHTTPYKWNQRTITLDGNAITNTVLSFTLTTLLPHQYLYTTWEDSGTDKSHIPYQCPAIGPGDIQLTLKIKLEDKTLLEEALQKTSTGKDFVIKFERDTNDYIQYTLSNLHVHEASVGYPAVSGFAEATYVMKAESISIEVKDQIDSSLYEG